MTETYKAYLLRYVLTIQDPDLPQPRYHTTIFVETSLPSPSTFNTTTPPLGTGTIHQVTGDITSPSGMYYFPQPKSDLDAEQQPHSIEFIGVTPKSTYPENWDKLLRSIKPPGQQKMFNVKTMRTGPFKTLHPLTFYEEGEARRLLVECTEWTLRRFWL
ncbi:uncharacterized protein BDV14DRAFT_204124 [Aspergillus stella-maris]|uniref:uncharacterized protein n=1 Tax=Aspergillus stella-maris TaxID=1810926 RepID=UPI003CCE1204